MKTLLTTVLLVTISSANAADKTGRFGIGIGDVSEVKLIMLLNDSVSVKYGFYVNEFDSILNSNASPGYSRDQIVHILGARLYTDKPEVYRWFVDIEYAINKITYAGDINNQSYDQTTLGGYSGVEYYLSDKVSIDARLGIEFYERKYETFREEGEYFPTTNMSLNYLF